jgi:hypothetical protein
VEEDGEGDGSLRLNVKNCKYKPPKKIIPKRNTLKFKQNLNLQYLYGYLPKVTMTNYSSFISLRVTRALLTVPIHGAARRLQLLDGTALLHVAGCRTNYRTFLPHIENIKFLIKKASSP